MTQSQIAIALIARPEGACKQEIMAATGQSCTGAAKMLCKLRARGDIALWAAANASRWFLPGKVPPPAPPKPPGIRTTWTQRKARVLTLAGRPDGVCTRELASEFRITPRNAEGLMQRLRRKGLIECLVAANASRWYLAGQLPRRIPLARGNNRSIMPEKPPPRPRYRGPEGPVIIPDGLQVQRGPSWTHDVRWQLAPGDAAQFKGEFSRLGPGRYL